MQTTVELLRMGRHDGMGCILFDLTMAEFMAVQERLLRNGSPW